MINNKCLDTEYERAYNITPQEWQNIYSSLKLSETSKVIPIVQFYFISQLAKLTFNKDANCWHLKLIEGFDRPLELIFNVRDDSQREIIDGCIGSLSIDNLLDVEKSSMRIRLKSSGYVFTIKFKGGIELNYPVNLEDWMIDVLFACYPRIEKTRYTFLYQGNVAEADIYSYPVKNPRIEFEFDTQELCDSFILKGLNAQDVTGVKGQSNKEEAVKAYFDEKAKSI